MIVKPATTYRATMSRIKNAIVSELAKAENENYEYCEIYTQEDMAAKHEYVFFVKPEINIKDQAIKHAEVYQMLFDKMNEFGMQVAKVSVLGASYMEHNRIIASHYGVINQLAVNAKVNLSQQATNAFAKLYGSSVESEKVLGAFEFMKEYPMYDAGALRDLWQSKPYDKLAGGTYCLPVKVKSGSAYLINGFHPNQLVNYYARGRAIVVFKLVGDSDWSTARNNFIGNTSPAQANIGSVRSELYMRHHTFGLSEFHSSRNGVHLSAGPVESMVESMRFLVDHRTLDEQVLNWEGHSFGELLRTFFSRDELVRIATNPTVAYNGQSISIFDLTEEMNYADAFRVLKELKGCI